VAWSIATIGGVPIDQALAPGTFDRDEIAAVCKHKAQEIIKAKGATVYGIGSIVASICNTILFDKLDVRPISHYLAEFGCCLSLPVVLGRRGVVKALPLPLSDDEKAALKQSAQDLKGAFENAKKDLEG
jgi:L-lactate dehydrogenase